MHASKAHWILHGYTRIGNESPCTRALTPLMVPQMFNLDRNEKRDYLSVGETELDTLYWVGSGGKGWTLGGFMMRGEGG